MEALFTTWWAWMVAGVALGAIEVFAPGIFFLGFAIGAVLTGVIVGFGLVKSLPLLLLIFAILSLIAWAVVRKISGKREGQVKIWDRDINDNP